MKNYEKYKEKIDKRDNPQCYVYYELMGNKNCKSEGCSSGCFIKTIRWLLEEYVEPIKLSNDEYVILKNLPSEYKWIVRDDAHLEIFTGKPEKTKYTWVVIYEDDTFECLYLFQHLFKFVKFEDDEPYSIAKLIADYEKEHGDGN